MDPSAHRLVTIPLSYAGLGQYDAEAYMPVIGAFQDKIFSKISFNEMIWNLAPGIGFNPSLTLLPDRVKNALNISGAKFAASVRHRLGQCGNLGIGETKYRSKMV